MFNQFHQLITLECKSIDYCSIKYYAIPIMIIYQSCAYTERQSFIQEQTNSTYMFNTAQVNNRGF